MRRAMVDLLSLSLSFFFFFFSSTFYANVFVRCLTLRSDVEALKAFKAAIDPRSIPQGSCLDSWNFSMDPCAIPRRTSFICGVTCSGVAYGGASRVTAITVDSVGYSGWLSPSVGKLTELAELDLSENKFYGRIPLSVFSLPKLQVVSLRINLFSGSLPSSMANCKSIEQLDLSNNSLSGPLPADLTTMRNLKRLDLSYNGFNETLPLLPRKLEVLAMKGNRLSGPLRAISFRGLSQLAVVELGGNMLTGELENWFFLMPSLQQINLTNNQLTGLAISNPAGRVNNLVAVDLGFNLIEGQLPANLSAYPMLAALTLRHNLLSGKIPRELVTMKNLKRLFLDGNFLRGKPPSVLFTNGTDISGSLGDNCLDGCPAYSQLCFPAQKPPSICRRKQ